MGKENITRRKRIIVQEKEQEQEHGQEQEKDKECCPHTILCIGKYHLVLFH